MAFQTFDRESTDAWFLSGEPVVRLYGRDFDLSPDGYCEWLLELARNYQVEVQVKKLSDPPGVVVRAYLGEPPERLVDPLLVVNQKSMPWIFCTYKGCSNRLADRMPPGGVCAQHIGSR